MYSKACIFKWMESGAAEDPGRVRSRPCDLEVAVPRGEPGADAEQEIKNLDRVVQVLDEWAIFLVGADTRT